MFAQWTVEVVVALATVVVPVGCMIVAGVWWWQHRQDGDLRSMDRRVTTVETRTEDQGRRLAQGDAKFEGIVHEMGKMNQKLGRVEANSKHQVDASRRTETKLDEILHQLTNE